MLNKVYGFVDVMQSVGTLIDADVRHIISEGAVQKAIYQALLFFLSKIFSDASVKLKFIDKPVRISFDLRKSPPATDTNNKRFWRKDNDGLLCLLVSRGALAKGNRLSAGGYLFAE